MAHGCFYKLTYSNYDKETGISIAQISTPYGSFIGQAHLHPDDMQYASSFAGQGMAENRAVISYFKHRIALINKDIRTTKQIYAEIDNKTRHKRIKNTDHMHLAYAAILDYRTRLEKQKKEFEDNIVLLNKTIKSFEELPKTSQEIVKILKDKES